VASLCRDHKSLFERKCLVHFLRQLQQIFGFDAVDLVDSKSHFGFANPFGERLKDRFNTVCQSAMRLNQEHDNIGVRCTTPRCRNHRTVQTTARAKQARRVDKHDLFAVTFHRNTADAGAGGLNLVRHDRHFRANHPV
jgi:hypothetical protein